MRFGDVSFDRNEDVLASEFWLVLSTFEDIHRRGQKFSRFLVNDDVDGFLRHA